MSRNVTAASWVVTILAVAAALFYRSLFVHQNEEFRVFRSQAITHLVNGRHLSSFVLPHLMGLPEPTRTQLTDSVWEHDQMVQGFFDLHGVGGAPPPIKRMETGPTNNTSEGIRQPADGLPKPSM